TITRCPGRRSSNAKQRTGRFRTRNCSTCRSSSSPGPARAPRGELRGRTRDAMEQIRWAQQRGLKVYGETCPQYISLTADDLKGLNMDESGGKYVCSPPPPDSESWKAIWDGITQGVFKTFSSDHCPYFYEGTAGKLHPKARTSFRWVPN